MEPRSAFAKQKSIVDTHYRAGRAHRRTKSCVAKAEQRVPPSPSKEKNVLIRAFFFIPLFAYSSQKTFFIASR